MLPFRALASNVFSAIHVSTNNYDSDTSNNWQVMEYLFSHAYNLREQKIPIQMDQ
jgi:hypothetical protein